MGSSGIHDRGFLLYAGNRVTERCADDSDSNSSRRFCPGNSWTCTIRWKRFLFYRSREDISYGWYGFLCKRSTEISLWRKFRSIYGFLYAGLCGYLSGGTFSNRVFPGSYSRKNMAESPVEYSFWDFSDLSLGQWFQGWTSGSRDTSDNRNAFSGHSRQKAEKSYLWDCGHLSGGRASDQL